MIRIYGIPNCDTMKKAFTWLKAHEIEYQFHDYKKAGIDASLLDAWIARIGWEPLLNRRGMTWRKLNDGIKANIDLDSARTLMLENPSIIRRPVLDNGDKLTVGFTEENYRALFRE
ncbi:MAG: ArsC family reductase [Gammaproteobacteria bacterium]|nr:ArsC family reductase [Gammaproteobacteria bacterium]HXK57684.1 ArsC family reductase [Gammaproteobacteria bacterium]